MGKNTTFGFLHHKLVQSVDFRKDNYNQNCNFFASYMTKEENPVLHPSQSYQLSYIQIERKVLC